MFAADWMFLDCAKMSLGLLPVLATRFFSEGDKVLDRQRVPVWELYYL